MDLIELRGAEIPQLDAGEAVEVQDLRGRAGFAGVGGERRGLLCEDFVAVVQFGLEGDGGVGDGALEEALDLERRRGGERIDGAGEDVLEEEIGDDAQTDLAIDAAEGHVVDLVAEGRDVFALGGVEVNGEDVGRIPAQVRREFEGEGSVAALVFAERVAVDPDGGGGHGAFEVDEDALAACGGGKAEVAAVGGDELVVGVVEAVPGEELVGVRKDDGGEGAVVEVWVGVAGCGGGMEEPVAIDGDASRQG